MTRKQITNRREFLFKEYQAGRITASKLCKMITQLEQQNTKELAESRAEIAVLKAALWYFGNSRGPDVAEELENALPECLSRKINLTEIANTNGEAAIKAAERGE